VGRARRSILQDGVKRAASKKQKLLKKNVNTVFFFMKGLVLRNTIQLGTTRVTKCSFFSIGLRSIT
jgi:hypothetical protein